MKKYVLAASIAALVSSPAFAGSPARDTFTIEASVPLECSVDDPVNVNFGELAVINDSGAGALLLEENRFVERQRIWVSCNYPTTITLEGQPMENTTNRVVGPEAAQFTDQLNYRLRLRASGNGTPFSDLELRTVDNSSVSETPGTAFHNRAQLRTVINTNDLDKRLLAGDYQATATITVGAI